MTVPNGANSWRNLSSSMVSSKFFTNKLTPVYLLRRSILSASNFFFSSAWRSAFFWARPTKTVFPSRSWPEIFQKILKNLLKNHKFLHKLNIFKNFWHFVSTIVLTRFKNFFLKIEKNFWNSRLKADNLQNFWDH